MSSAAVLPRALGLARRGWLPVVRGAMAAWLFVYAAFVAAMTFLPWRRRGREDRSAELMAAFEDGTLPGEAFTHAAHVEVAWAFLRRDPLPLAAQRFSAALRRFAASLGAAGKYHETITWAFLVLIQERQARCAAADFTAFAAANSDLFERGVLERHYRPETLASELARRVFVLPDRATTP